MKLVREYSFLDIRIVTGILMLISLLVGAKLHQPEYIWTCWTKTMPPATQTWHPIKCPKGMRK